MLVLLFVVGVDLLVSGVSLIVLRCYAYFPLTVFAFLDCMYFPGSLLGSLSLYVGYLLLVLETRKLFGLGGVVGLRLGS